MNHRTEREKGLYQCVKSKLRRDMKDTITSLIHKTRDSVEQGTVDADFIVNEVSQIVTTSDAYKTLKRSIVMGIINEKCQHSISEDRHVDREDCVTSLNSPHVNSSQCSYVILGTKDLQVATKLLLSTSLQDKFHSLNLLRQTSSLEQFVCPEVWPALQSALKDGLHHPVATVGEFCLDIYINMMVSSSPVVVKEGYSGLLEFLSSCKAKDLEATSKSYKNFMEQPYSKIFMQTVCIVNKFQQCIPKHWLRYPQNIMEEIIKSTFKHFSSSLDQSSVPVVINFWIMMTVVDTDNIWLKNWMHERLSRKFVVNAIREYPEIIERLLLNINGFSKEMVTDTCNHQKCDLLLYEISFSVSFLSRLLQYSEGRNLLFLIHGSEISNICNLWSSIIKSILVLCHSSLKFYKYNTDFASLAIYSLWENVISSWDVEDRAKILKPLLLSFEYCETANFDCYTFLINESAKLISAVSVFDSARSDLFNLKLDKNFQNVIDWLTNESSSERFIGKYNLYSEILINVVKTYRNMVSSPRGIISARHIASTLALIQSFQTCWSRQSDCETPTSEQNTVDKNEMLRPNSLHEEISKATLALLSSPLGTILLCEANCLLESVNYMIESYSGLCENSTTGLNCNCYNKCFMWFYLYSSNVKAIQKNKLLLMFPNKIWQHFAFYIDSAIDQYLKYTSVTNKLKSLVFLYIPSTALYNEILHKVDILDTHKVWKSVCLLQLDDTFLTPDDLSYIGSSMLCSLVCSVKMLLYLEQKLQIRAFLLKLLKGHTLNGVIIIDESSVLWNHILVRSFLIGGPKERKLPPKYIKNVTENYDWPFVSEESVIVNYWQFETKSQTDEAFLPIVQLEGVGQKDYQKMVVILLKNNDMETLQHLGVLLEEIVNVLPADNFGFNIACTSVANLSDNENIGVEFAFQYGVKLRLFECSDPKTELKYTLETSKVSINGITYTEEFDIFVATAFLILKGDGQKTCKLIEYYAGTCSCLYNWLLPLQVFLRCQKLQQLHAFLSQFFEVIMKESLPRVHSAFQMCGLSPSVVLWHWTSQCFWNYLDWTEICKWMLLTVSFGGGAILYFAAAVMKHLEQDILIHTQTLTLLDYLKETSFSEFKTCDHINFILKLLEKYSNQIECGIKECLKL